MREKITINDVYDFCFNNINNKVKCILGNTLFTITKLDYTFCEGIKTMDDKFYLSNHFTKDGVAYSATEIYNAMSQGRLVLMCGDLDKLEVLKFYKDVKPKPKPNNKTIWEHKIEFLKSFHDSVDAIGGNADRFAIRNMTLEQMTAQLAQNGLRFTYLKKEEM